MSAASSNNNNTQYWESILLEEFNNRFSQAHIKGIMDSAVSQGFSVMRDSTPVKTGKLKASEGFTIDPSGFEGEMHVNAEYAGHVNGGTSRQRPQPFADRGASTAFNILKNEISAL